MKREIVFRGKENDGHWVYGNYIKGCYCNPETMEMKERHIISSDILLHDVDPKTIGQFTGLRDKNGKEIYEGDILSIYGMGRFIVRYSSEHCQFELATRFLGDGFVDKLWQANIDRYSVIGNIYDDL